MPEPVRLRRPRSGEGGVDRVIQGIANVAIVGDRAHQRHATGIDGSDTALDQLAA
jgi:hypothetical protein